MSKKTILKLVNETLIEIEWEVNIMGASILGCTSSVNVVKTPLEIAGVAAWFDAAYGTFSENTGASATTPETSDGGLVGTWVARRNTGDSSNLYAISPFGGANRVVYKTSQVAGKPVIRFAGSASKHLSLNSVITGTGARTVIGVVKPNVVGSGLCFVDLAANTSNDSTAYGVSADVKVDMGNDTRVFNAAGGTSAFSIVAVSTPAGGGTSNTSAWLNGTSLGVSSTVNTAAMNTGENDTLIGKMHGNQWWGGDIAELIIFNVALSDADRRSVEEYLAGKYAI